MNIKLKVLSTMMSGVFLVSTFSFIPSINTFAVDTCVINPSVEYQTIKGFGGMNHPEWTGSDLTDEQRQTAFGNGDDELGLSIVRIYVNNDKNQWYKALATAQDVVSRGGIVFATPWNPPSDMCETFTRTYTTWDGQTVTQENQKRLRYDKYEEYAEYLNEFVHYMKDNGVDLYAISIQNEPDYGEDWTWMTSDECVDFLANYADKIDCPVMSPESFSYNKEYYTKILNNSDAYANTDIFGTHFYGTSRENMDFPELENCGKEIFMTEVYVPNSEANSNERWPESIQVAENIHNALVVGNMNAYVWWYIRRNYGPINEDGTISKRGYCMAQYSKFVRPEDVRIDATEQPTDDVYISAYKNDENQLTIVAINESDTGYAQNFSISGEIISEVDRYRTSETENLAETQNLEHSDNSFYAQLPAQSVSTFVIELEDDGETEPNDYGWYFYDSFEDNTCDWSARGSNKVGLSGRTSYVGTNSLLVSDRTAVWNGAEKSLDTSVFKAGEEYSFSVCVSYLDGADSEKFSLTLQYTGTDGETHYANIDSKEVVKGNFVQLYNKNYKIPDDVASDLKLVVETTGETMNFYMDEAIGAVAGTTIVGPEPVETTTVSTTTTTTTTTSTLTKYLAGDANCDGIVDIADAVAVAGYVGDTVENSLSDEGKINADVQGNGNGINAGDALMIQQYLAKIVDELTLPDDVTKNVAETTTTTKSDVSSDPTVYMNNVRANLSEYAVSGITDKKDGVDYGTLTKYTYYSTTRERMTNVNVLLPAGYNENEKYPVLYALHGYWENEDTLVEMGKVQEQLGNLIASGEAEKMIIVFPYIYTSKTQESCSGLDLANSLNYDNFVNDLKTDLMPYIESNFSVKTGRENTAITGFSMGGRESLFIGLTNTDLFGYIGATCPAPGLTPGSDLSMHPGQLQESELTVGDIKPYLIFITGGTSDSVVFNQPSTYHDILTTNGVDHVWHTVTNGEHNSTSVQPHMYNYLRSIFKVD